MPWAVYPTVVPPYFGTRPVGGELWDFVTYVARSGDSRHRLTRSVTWNQAQPHEAATG